MMRILNINRKKIETLDGVSTFRSQSVAEK